jgi:hypothetical protein
MSLSFLNPNCKYNILCSIGIHKASLIQMVANKKNYQCDYWAYANISTHLGETDINVTSSFLINNAFLWVLFIFLCVPRISWVVIINQLLIKNISHSMHVDGLMRDIISLRSSNVFRFACYNISRILTAMELTYVSQYSFVLFSVKE